MCMVDGIGMRVEQSRKSRVICPSIEMTTLNSWFVCNIEFWLWLGNARMTTRKPLQMIHKVLPTLAILLVRSYLFRSMCHRPWTSVSTFP